MRKVNKKKVAIFTALSLFVLTAMTALAHNEAGLRGNFHWLPILKDDVSAYVLLDGNGNDDYAKATVTVYNKKKGDMRMPDIVLNNITKNYYVNHDKVTQALKNINLNIKQGEFVAIKGPSGAGKSTLLHIIGCNDKHSSGTYRLGEINIDESSSKVLAKLRNRVFGFVLQDYGLIDNETVLNNVYLPLMFRKGRIKEMKEKAIEVLAKFNMEKFAGNYVKELSGGEKQRVAIARAIINEPEIILADEPTGSLDTTNSQIIMDILKGLNQQGKTVIIITHDANIANQCNYIISISDGECIDDV